MTTTLDLLAATLAGNAFWHRILLEPFAGDTLAHQHQHDGYHPPDVLRRAIILRDGVCAGTGCLRPGSASSDVTGGVS